MLWMKLIGLLNFFFQNDENTVAANHMRMDTILSS